MVFAVWRKGVTGRGVHWAWISGVIEEVLRNGQAGGVFKGSKDGFCSWAGCGGVGTAAVKVTWGLR